MADNCVEKEGGDVQIPYILVPIQHTEQFVQVFVDELPDDEKDLLDLLRAEIAPLDIWHQFAVEYYRQGRRDAFREILKEAKNGFDQFERKKLIGKEKLEFNESRLKIINGLAADLIMDLIENRNNDDRLNTVRTEIRSYLNDADRINPECHLTWACKSLYEMIDGKGDFVDRAESWAKNLLKDEASNIPGLLVKAAAHFQRAERTVEKAARRREYDNSRRCYETVLRSKPDCDPSVRLGIALCCSRLGQVQQARFALERVLALDANSVDATVGLCLLDLAAIPHSHNDRQTAMNQATRSLLKIRDTRSGGLSPMVLNHTANRSFWTFVPVPNLTLQAVEESNEFSSTEMLPDHVLSGVPVRVGDNFEALVVSSSSTSLTLSKSWDQPAAEGLSFSLPNYKQAVEDAGSAYWYSKNKDIKAEAYYFLGRTEHARKQFGTAEKYYRGAVHLCSAFAPAQMGLAKMLIRNREYPKAIAALEAAVAEFPEASEALLLLGKLHEQQAGVYLERRDDTRARSHSERSLDYLVAACEADGSNADAWLARAASLQRDASRSSEALEAYERAVKLLHSSNKTISVTVHSNLGALQHSCGRYGDAKASYHAALEADHAEYVASNDKARHTLYVMEPANSPLWSWETVEGSASAEKGAIEVCTSEDLSKELRPHEQLLLVASEGSFNFRADVAEEPQPAFKVVLKQRIPNKLTHGALKRKVSRLPIRPSNVTTCFNLACVHEALGDWFAAIELYKAVTIKFPKYNDAALRLAKVYDVLGMSNKALGHLDRTQKGGSKEPAPAALAGALLLRSFDTTGKTKRLDQAKQAFEKIQHMDPKLQRDPYSVISVANIYFSNLHRTASGSYLKELGWAKSMYESVLKHDKSCVHAATGVAMVMAEEGHLAEAQEILGIVKMSATGADIPDATLNFAHMLAISGKYLEALKNYNSLLKRAPNYGKDHELLLLISNALYCDSRHKEAMRALSRALRSNPCDATLWHNCGVVQYSFAQELFEKHRHPGATAAGDITAAGDYATSAKRIFSVLLAELEANEVSPTDWGGRLRGMGVDAEKLKELMAFCDKAITQVPERVRVATELTALQDQRRLERASAAEAAARAETDARAQAEAEKAELKEKAAVRARLRQEQLKSLQGFEEATSQKKRKKAKETDPETMTAMGYGFSSEEDDNVDDPPSVPDDRSQKKLKISLQRVSGLSDSEDEFDAKPKPSENSKQALMLSDSEDEFDEKPKPSENSKQDLGLSDSEDEGAMSS